MRLQFLSVLILTSIVASCAHHQAVRVECDNRLRPINQPLSLVEPPVTSRPVEPAEPDPPKPANSKLPSTQPSAPAKARADLPDDGDLFQ
jgi:hypothetical protein